MGRAGVKLAARAPSSELSLPLGSDDRTGPGWRGTYRETGMEAGSEGSVGTNAGTGARHFATDGGRGSKREPLGLDADVDAEAVVSDTEDWYGAGAHTSEELAPVMFGVLTLASRPLAPPFCNSWLSGLVRLEGLEGL